MQISRKVTPVHIVMFALVASSLCCEKRPAPAGSNAASSPANGSFAGPILIKPRFSPGQIDYLEFKQDVSQVYLQGGDTPIETGLRRHYGMIRKIESVSDSSIRYTLTLDRAGHVKRSTNIRLSYDSDFPLDNETLPILGECLKPLIGKTLTIQADLQGNVTSVDGIAVWRAAVEAVCGTGPFQKDLEFDFSEQRVKMLWCSYLFAPYPNREVRVGDSWRNVIQNELPMLGRVEEVFNCNLEKITERGGRRLAHVAYLDRLQYDRRVLTQTPNNPLTEYVAEYKGTAIFSDDRGEFIERSQEGRVTSVTRVPNTAPNSSAHLATMQIRSSQTVTLRTLEDRERERLANAEEQRRRAASQPASAPAPAAATLPTGGRP